MDSNITPTGKRRAKAFASTIACGAVTALAFGALTPLAASATEAPAIAPAVDETQWVNPLAPAQRATVEKHRTIVTQDGEVDDMDSFIRFLYYANEFDIAGIVYSSSTYHYAGNGADVAPFRWTGTEWVNTYIDKYAELYPNLVKHAEGYPTPQELKDLYTIGNISNVSDMSVETEGSEWIESVVLDDDPRPVYIQTWGGLNTAARALKSIQEDYEGTAEWPAIQEKINNKVIIYNILNQDATLNSYIKPNWPGIKVIDNQSQFWSFAYLWKNTVPAPYQYTLKAAYMNENFLNGHGSLLEEYRTYKDGKPTPGDDQNNRWRPEESSANQNVGYDPHDFISEGDSPAFMYLLDSNGLRSAEDPTYGGWGGRFKTNATGWLDTTDVNTFTGNAADRRFPQTRWVEELQNDFASRADWGIASEFGDANHAPDVWVDEGIDLNRVKGDAVSLTAGATDPDGDELSYEWWQYTDADTYAGAVQLSSTDQEKTSFVVPEDAQAGDTIHLIAEVTDGGSPAITRYQRVIVTVVDSYSPQIAAEQPAIEAATDGTGTATVAGVELFDVDSVVVGGTVVEDVTVNGAGTEVTFPVPESETSGDVALEVRVGSTAIAAGTLDYIAPTITKVSPGTVDVAGGVDVTVRGTGLGTAEEVLIGGVTATDVSVNSAGTVVTATVPAGTRGAADVEVALTGQDAVATDALTYSKAAAATSTKLTVSTKRPVYGKDSVTLTATVKGATSGKVEFFDRGTKVGSASVSAAGVAKRTLGKGSLKPGTHAFTAKFVGTADSAPSASSAVIAKVAKATPGKVTVKGAKFAPGKRPTVTVKVATLNNGKAATGKVEISVNGSKVKTVSLKSGGKATVKLPKKYSSSIAVKVKYKGNSTTSSRSSNTTVVQVKR